MTTFFSLDAPDLYINIFHFEQGLNKPWEKHQLTTFKPVPSIYDGGSRMTEASYPASYATRSRAESQPRRRPVEPTRHMARPSEDEDSVFDGEFKLDTVTYVFL